MVFNHLVFSQLGPYSFKTFVFILNVLKNDQLDHSIKKNVKVLLKKVNVLLN